MGAVIILSLKKHRKVQRKLYLLGRPTASVTDLAAYRKAAEDVLSLPPCFLEIEPQATGFVLSFELCANAILRWNPAEHALSEATRAARRIAERAVLRAMLCAGRFRYQPKP